jgi:hypothetical protein
MRQATLFLTVGLPATGKTTAARRLEVDQRALRLTKDEWMKALYGDENPTSASDVIEGRLIDIGLRALELGVNVVIDFGLWGRDERSALRQADAPDTTWPICDEELVGWADIMQVPTRGEIDGTEPIDDPPVGFGSWDAWRRDRWPASVA